MKRANIGHLKNNLSRYLDHVRSGGEVIVLDRQRPIARILPLVHDAAEAGQDEAELALVHETGAANAPPGERGLGLPHAGKDARGDP